MIAACPKCSARYRIERGKLRPEGARLRCSRCEAVFRVRPPEVEEPAPPPVVRPEPEPAPEPAPMPTPTPEPTPVAVRSEPTATSPEIGGVS